MKRYEFGTPVGVLLAGAVIIMIALISRRQFSDMRNEYREMMRTCNTRITSIFDNQPRLLDYATLSTSEHGAMHDAGDIRPEHEQTFPVCAVVGDREAEVGVGESVQWNDVQPEPIIRIPPKVEPQP